MDIQVEKFRDDNLVLLERWGKTDPSITKQVNKGGGRTITSIDCLFYIHKSNINFIQQ